MTQPFPDAVPVLIVGAGPVGMALAAELARYGVKCLVVEQTDGAIDHPRASALNARTMEFCRRWGIADKVRDVGTPPDFSQDALYVTSFSGHLITRIDRPTHGGGAAPLPFSPERPQRCNQIWFNPVLRDHIAGLSPVSLRMRCRYDAVEEVGDFYRSIVTDLETGAEHTVESRFVVACCGGRSAVPRAVGVRMGEESILSHSINIFFRCRELWSLHDKGAAALNFFIGPDGMWGGVTAQDGREYWRLTLHGTKDYVDPASIDAHAALRRAFGGDFPYELLNTVAWARREWVAGCFAKDGLFLAGDSAHQNSPTGGFGMNTGMGDAVDLGWKLAAMVQGWAARGLAASYEAERRPVALRNVREAAENFHRYRLPDVSDVEDSGPAGQALRAQLARELSESQRRQVLTDGIALGYRYDPSPICVPDGTPAPPDEPGRYVQTARPGSRAPHGWLADGRSTLDLFGEGFVLLQFGADAADAEPLVRAARDRGVPVECVAIDAPDIARLYEKNLVLVRPDGHVAWRGDTAPADPGSVIDTIRGG